MAEMSSEQQIRDAVDRFLAQVRQDTDARLQALAAELLQAAREDEATGVVPVERAAIEVARAVGRGGVHARHDLISRVIADTVFPRGVVISAGTDSSSRSAERSCSSSD